MPALCYVQMTMMGLGATDPAMEAHASRHINMENYLGNVLMKLKFEPSCIVETDSLQDWK